MNKTLMQSLLIALGAIGVLTAAALLPGDDSLPPSQQTAQEQSILPTEGCELLQTLHYDRCGHTVVRRVTAPVEVYGQTLEAVSALYTDWQITEFSAPVIKMEQQFRTFCPDHLVLMPDGAGMLCVFENKYGDALSMVSELNIAVRDLPAAAQEDVENGLGFATTEELDMWLESVES